MTRRPRMRVVSNQDVVTDAKIIAITSDEEGNDIETDISHVVQGVDIHLHVGEPARLDAALIFADFEGYAEVNDVVLTVIPPRVIPTVISKLLSDFVADGGDIREITVFGDFFRNYAEAA